MRSSALAVCLAIARAAAAHDVQVNPGACTFDPVELFAPASGTSASAAAATDADRLRVVYGPATATAQFQQRMVAPRGFEAGGVAGTVALPQAWNARLAASGDLYAADVLLRVTLGGAAAAVAVHLTTAVAAAGDTIALGTPLAPDGRVTLAGVIPAGSLPEQLGGSVVLRLACRLTPAPDLGAFPPAPGLASLAGVLSPGTGKLRGTLAGAGLSPAELTGGPAVLHLEADARPIATVRFPDGFAPRGARALVARAADGSQVALGLANARARLVAVIPGVTIPPGLPDTARVEAILVAGPTIVRGARPFRLRGDTLRAGS